MALRNVPFYELGQVLSQANYLWLIPGIMFMVILNLIRGEIWRLLLGKRVKLADAFWAYSIGFLFNNIFPFRAGELARVIVLAGHRRLALVEVAATAGIERLLDMIAVITLLVVVLPFMEVPLEVKQGAIVFGIIIAIGLVVIFYLAKLGDRAENFLRRIITVIIPKYADPIMARWQELVRGLVVLTRPEIGLPALGWSILVWGFSVGAQWCIIRAFQPQAGLIEATFMVVAISLAIAVPAAPGFIGVYQWVGQQALVIPFPHLYTPGSALGIAIMAHLVSYLFSTALGIIGLWYFGQSFFELGRRVNKPGLVESETTAESHLSERANVNLS